jgi:cytoskeleton protein RodZ
VEDATPDLHGPQYIVGAELRDRREEFGLDLDTVGEALRIKPAYLAAIEQGRPQDLPGPTYAIGFVRAYAQYLGLDSDQVLDSFKAESAEAQARPDLNLPVPLGARSVPGGAILLVGFILALCGYGAWYYLSTGERSRPERVTAVPAELQQTLRGAAPVLPPTPPPPAAPAGETSDGPHLATGLFTSQDQPATQQPHSTNPALVAAPAAAAVPSQGDGAPAADHATPAAPDAATRPVMAISPPPAPASPGTSPANPGAANAAAKPAGRVQIRAVADCWIQVRSTDNQQIVFSRVLKAGEVYTVPRGGLSLRTGNAGALTIEVDGKPAPSIGGIGTLRRNVSLDPDPLMAGTAVHG